MVEKQVEFSEVIGLNLTSGNSMVVLLVLISFGNSFDVSIRVFPILVLGLDEFI